MHIARLRNFMPRSSQQSDPPKCKPANWLDCTSPDSLKVDPKFPWISVSANCESGSKAPLGPTRLIAITISHNSSQPRSVCRGLHLHVPITDKHRFSPRACFRVVPTGIRATLTHSPTFQKVCPAVCTELRSSTELN